MKCVQCQSFTCKNHHRLCDSCWGLREKEINKLIKKDFHKKWDQRMSRKQMINVIKLKAEAQFD